ncbi:hypothetical protein COO60DRAFT_1634686 [Scenedesmus sp. NREL 46B-D3]|nr:hypothetical protein COO60DRAFT_1634686 [Scenedesmus sp. NREL 46B-D3]
MDGAASSTAAAAAAAAAAGGQNAGSRRRGEWRSHSAGLYDCRQQQRPDGWDDVDPAAALAQELKWVDDSDVEYFTFGEGVKAARSAAAAAAALASASSPAAARWPAERQQTQPAIS